MKLKFNKTEDGDIAAVILDNTKQEAFSYIKMIAALLDGQPIECEYGEGITPEEQGGTSGAGMGGLPGAAR